MKKQTTETAVKKGFGIKAAVIAAAAVAAVAIPLGLYFMRDIDNDPMSAKNVICEGGDTDKADYDENLVTAYFELVRYNDEYKTCTVVSEANGLVSFALPENSRDIFARYERVPSGLTLSVTWSGSIMEIYPAALDHITRVEVMKVEARPDFMGEHYDKLLDSCRQTGGEVDLQAEVDKISGLTDPEREALVWFLSCEIYD